MDKHDHQPPEHLKLGKAKALEPVVLNDGTRLFKKTKVRFWIERAGAREYFYIVYNHRIYDLTPHEFKRRFKIIIKSGEVKLPSPAA